ncbi:MAG: enoyl-CoA hydratase/isomerase family protein [Verrucomicrobia bacterium]|nr:enoyl-CoA hydratase/isomerase family protein [Verrucomicrobiota bacterium]
MSDGDGAVHITIAGRVASVVFDRPEARNAMTTAMYDQLASACAAITAHSDVRVATFRGAGAAFAAGTDIREFLAFTSAEDGIGYERRIDAVVSAIESLPVPTIAVIDGVAMGGGLLIATVCDFRIATPSARFGVPIARTLGNCLSLANTARLVAALGPARTKRLLLLAGEMSAEEALNCGYLVEVVGPEAIDDSVRALCARLVSHSPISMRVAKESVRRVAETVLPSSDGEDLIRAAYGSEDFRAGVRAFLAKQRPEWSGR